MLLSMLAVTTACLRRELWVYTDEYRQVELYTDWSECPSRPGGMTAWFLSEEGDGRNRRITTSDVSHSWLNLPRGLFTGIIFDWSPAEFGSLVFTGMDRPETALVKAAPSVNQPVENDELYGGRAVPAGMVVPLNDTTGFYTLLAAPDPMCADTLKHVQIITGVEGDLIPWETREEYEASLLTQTFECQPHPITWNLRVQVYVKGLKYLHSMKGTIAGLADGNWLNELRHTASPCLHPLESWSTQHFSDSLGVVSTSIHTFGLPEQELTKTEGYAVLPHLRLNLEFLLRDEETILHFHFDVGEESVTIFEDQLLVRIEIPIEWAPRLPYVDAKGSAGFDAKVTPWQNGGNIDVTM